MDEAKKREVAVFRFGVISDFVVSESLGRGERERLLREKAERMWVIPHSRRTRLSVSTIASWIRQYERGGRRLEGLYPQGRGDQGQSRALDEEVAQLLIALRRELPRASVKVLVGELRRRKGVEAWARISPTTVYRFLKAQGLWERPEGAAPDRRRFEAEWPNDLWQSDLMHGPMVEIQGRQRKSFLIAFLDDMSRLVPHAQFYVQEGLESYLDGLRQALLRRGLPRRLYVDNGPSFRSQHLAQITAALGIALIHSTPYQPEGRGKVERWFRTVREQFLSRWRRGTLEELNQALNTWVDQQYHREPHSVTGQSPLERFAQHMECIRPAPPNLQDYFRKQTLRNVAKDRTVALNGRLYEAPVPLIGKKVVLLYHDHDPARVEVLFEGRSHGFLPLLDQHVNFRVRRTHHQIEIQSEERSLGGGRLAFPKEDAR